METISVEADSSTVCKMGIEDTKQRNREGLGGEMEGIIWNLERGEMMRQGIRDKGEYKIGMYER